jgi:hypothetical protein
MGSQKDITNTFHEETALESMKPALKPNHRRASITLYAVVALNEKGGSEYTINRTRASEILAGLLDIDRSIPLSWLRGDFKKRPLSRENFLKFVRAYRAKEGLETPKKITALAVDLYGSGYQRALELLDPQDREVVSEHEAPLEKKDLASAIFDLIKSSSPEEVKQALMLLMGQRLEAE